jgi:hypothetical protein
VKPKKPSAADRTISMFGAPAPIEERPVEVVESDVHEGERKTLAEDADRLRGVAFQGQEWTTKLFGKPDAPGNQYRVTLKGEHYYVEALDHARYVGLMIDKRDLYNLVTVLVQAVRDKQAREASGGK